MDKSGFEGFNFILKPVHCEFSLFDGLAERPGSTTLSDELNEVIEAPLLPLKFPLFVAKLLWARATQLANFILNDSNNFLDSLGVRNQRMNAFQKYSLGHGLPNEDVVVAALLCRSRAAEVSSMAPRHQANRTVAQGTDH